MAASSHPRIGLHAILPLSVATDSYKAAHFAQYPQTTKMVAYGEFRAPFQKDKTDNRFVFYGIRYLIESYLLRQWTEDDVHKADLFYKTHNAGNTPFPFPKDLFLKFVRENNGYFPIKVEALPEGTAANIHTPVYQITSEGEWAPLCTFFETILTHVWYPTCVATLSRRCRDVIEAGFARSTDEDAFWKIPSRLHDFGFRGCTSLEQSVIGGTAHLLNFTGSDTMSACYYAQFELNHGKPVGQSIPATEHSVMTSWPTEEDAINNMIEKFGDGVFACVMDSYDYNRALDVVLPNVVKHKQSKGGFMVLRPDSGDPVESVLLGLAGAERAFGVTVNKKGFKVINGAGVIQGDGVSLDAIRRILDKVIEAGYSAENVAFGMGGGLLQKVDRDTMSFATKLSRIEYAPGAPGGVGGTGHDVMKLPKTDLEKASLPGVLAVKRDEHGVPAVYPADGGHVAPAENLLKVVYDKGPVAGLEWEDFDSLKKRVAQEWTQLPKWYDPISKPLAEKRERWVVEKRRQLAEKS